MRSRLEFALLISLAGLALLGPTAYAQLQSPPSKPGQPAGGAPGGAPSGVPSPAPAQPSAPAAPRKEGVGPVADAIHPYKPAGRDPFKKAVIKGQKAKAPAPVGFPSIEARQADFKQKIARARATEQPEPNPLSQYLVTELEIMGIFSDGSGPGAFVKATPTGTLFFVRRGAHCYNGEITKIESDSPDSAARVLFREVSYAEMDGKRSAQERIVAKLANNQSK
jgi:hypothetical protein